MKILIVSQYFWPENFRINDLATGLRAREHEVTVLTGIPNYPEGSFFKGYGIGRNRKESYEGVSILRVPLLSRGKSKGLRLALNYFSFAFFASVLGPFLCREKYDVIFVFEPSPVTVGIPAIILSRLKKLPILFWVLDLWPESLSATGAVRSKLVLGAVGALVRFIYSECERVLVPSRGYIKNIEALGVRSSRIGYFPNWVEDVFSKEVSTVRMPDLPQGFRVLFAGNVGVAQDFGTILSAAERLKDKTDIHWLIVGDGRMLEWVREQVTSRGLHEVFHLMGRHPLDTMPSFFAAADAMLVTLKKDPIFSLTIPGKIQSYLAAGKPIISAMDGEGAQLIREAQAGLACAAEDPDALAEAVLAMYHASSDERRRMGENGSDFCRKHFEREMLLTRLEDWMYQAITVEKNGRHILQGG